jgi:hypothetical protein
VAAGGVRVGACGHGAGGGTLVTTCLHLEEPELGAGTGGDDGRAGGLRGLDRALEQRGRLRVAGADAVDQGLGELDQSLAAKVPGGRETGGTA